MAQAIMTEAAAGQLLAQVDASVKKTDTVMEALLAAFDRTGDEGIWGAIRELTGTKQQLLVLLSEHSEQYRVPPAPDMSLTSLSNLSTRTGESLLDLLEEAVLIGDRVDKERGNAISETIALAPGEVRGTDYGRTLNLLRIRLQREVRGAQGKD